jgi:hypothetical protein
MMEAHVEDFLTGLLDGCTVLMERWQRRGLTGADWSLARLACWEGLARALPSELSGPNGPRLDLDPAEFRLMASEARGLRLLHDLGPVDPDAMPLLIERLYKALASRFDPPAAFAAKESKDKIVQWAARHLSPPSLPQSAMAFVDFIQEAPLSARNDQIAALLASALPTWGGSPMAHVLVPDHRTEEGYAHALAAACEGEDGAWIAFYLGQARRALKRMPILRDGLDPIRQRWLGLLRKGPLAPQLAEHLVEELLALPVITPTLVAETGIEVGNLRDAMVLFFAADEAVEVDLPGDSFTILPAPLKLLVAP